MSYLSICQVSSPVLSVQVSRVKVKHDDGMASALDVASSVATTFVFGLAYFGKFIFDLLSLGKDWKIGR
jgi:hypothetical protein